MALGATICRASLAIADVDRAYYADHELRLARHPSETAERLMLRLLAFAMYANERLEFGRGLSTADEPDLWQRDDDGTVELWIELGLPDERRIRRALSRTRKLVVIAYGGRAVDIWWEREGAAITRLGRIGILAVPREASEGLEAFYSRTMNIHCTIQDGHIYLDDGERTLEILPRLLHAS